MCARTHLLILFNRPPAPLSSSFGNIHPCMVICSYQTVHMRLKQDDPSDLLVLIFTQKAPHTARMADVVAPRAYAAFHAFGR